jgi:hypothetical protein
MKPAVSPRTVAFLILGLLSPLAFANPEAQPSPARIISNGSKPASAEVSFHLPPPATSRKPSTRTAGTAKQERGNLRTHLIQRKVNAGRLARYEIDPNSFVNGLAAAAAAYREVSSR